jgi:DNA-binding IclR family transcriptional regulator
MRSFSARYGETMHLAVLDRGRLVYVQKVEGAHTSGVPTHMGARRHAHSSAVGKTLLAALERGARGEVVRREGLPAFTRRTITDPCRLADELDRVLLQGFAFDRAETIEGFSCVGVPMRAATGRVIAALSVCARTERFERHWPTYLRSLQKIAEAASKRLTARAIAASEPSLSAADAAVVEPRLTSGGDGEHAA